MFQRQYRNLACATCALAGSLLIGCESAPKAEEQSLLLFPAPPEKPRVQFLTWFSGAAQVEPQRSTFADFILGDEPNLHQAISKPYGIAARDGVVYVCDTKGLALARIDFKSKTYQTLGASGPGRLRKPVNVVIDPLGYKFVVDPVRKQVVVFGPSDEYVTAYDVPEPCHPVDVALWENELYVLDNDESCQVVVLDRSTGEVVRTFGEPGGEPGQFKIPNSLAIDPKGFVYVSDTHNWRIQKLTREGKPIWTKGGPGYGLGMFGRPRGVRISPDGIVYVVDGATEIVQMFNEKGETLMRFGGPGNVPGSLALPSSLAIDATSVPYFREYAHPDFNVEYLLFVASQYGTRLINVYAFGSFPPGFQLSDAQVRDLPAVPEEEGIVPLQEDQAEPDDRDQPHAVQETETQD